MTKATDRQIQEEAAAIAAIAQSIADGTLSGLSATDGTLDDPRHAAARQLARNVETLLAWTERA